jgi:predicted MPP superfamily phosphohydrolase
MARFLTLDLLLHGYIALRLLPAMSGATAAVALVLIAASAVLLPLGLAAHRMPREPVADRLAFAGLLAAGAFSSLLVLTLLRDVLLFAANLLPAAVLPTASLSSLRSVSAAAVPLLAGVFTAVGLFNARRRASVRRVDVPIAGLPDGLRNFTIVQVSDLHVGPTIKRRYVDRIVDAVNELRPDMIAVTGDLVDGSVEELGTHIEPLQRMTARYGSYFVTGNHEYYSGVHPWIVEFRRLGLRVLLNEHVVLEHKGERVVIAGVTDHSGHHFDPAHSSDPHRSVAGAPENAIRVLLAHQPRSAFAAERAGFHLQLSGHTHGGQFLPWNFFVRLQQPFTAGLHRLGALWVYVSRGTGYWGPPKRLGAPSEITHLRLVPA